MHYGDIRYDLFLFGIFHYFRLKRLLLHVWRGEKKSESKSKEDKNIEFISRFKYP